MHLTHDGFSWQSNACGRASNRISPLLDLLRSALVSHTACEDGKALFWRFIYPGTGFFLKEEGPVQLSEDPKEFGDLPVYHWGQQQLLQSIDRATGWVNQLW